MSEYLSGRLLGTSKICLHSSYCADIMSTQYLLSSVHIEPSRWTFVHVVLNEQ